MLERTEFTPCIHGPPAILCVVAGSGTPHSAAAAPKGQDRNLSNTDTLPPALQLARDSSLGRTPYKAKLPQCAGADCTDGQRPAGNRKEEFGLAYLRNPAKKL